MDEGEGNLVLVYGIRLVEEKVMNLMNGWEDVGWWLRNEWKDFERGCWEKLKV